MPDASISEITSRGPGAKAARRTTFCQVTE
jgi:hypothetical protein